MVVIGEMISFMIKLVSFRLVMKKLNGEWRFLLGLRKMVVIIKKFLIVVIIFNNIVVEVDEYDK